MTEHAKKLTWRDQLIGALLATGYAAWLVKTARNLGFARDEGVYFSAANEYSKWFTLLTERPAAALKQPAIDSAWTTNHEHPAFMKGLFAISKTLFFDKFHVFADMSTAFRFPGMVMSGIALWITYLFGARVYSRQAGIVAACLLGLMPTVFYHAHLACFDMPIVCMWIGALYAYYRSAESPTLLRSILLGIVYGLTLNTKHNAWILPLVIVPHALFIRFRETRQNVSRGLLPLPMNVLAMLTIGPLVFYATWPWIWNDTVVRLQQYVAFHVNHDYYNMEFLGQNYFSAPSPRAYMPVMIAATVPTATLLLFVTGAAERLSVAFKRVFGVFAWTTPARPDALHVDLLLAVAFCAAIGPWLLPKTPIFGGSKHWMTAYPVLCLFAGRGFDLVTSVVTKKFAVSDPKRRVWIQFALAASVLLAPLIVTAHSHPFGLSTYVPLAGGVRGGATIGLNRQFWGYTTQNANAEYLEKNAPPNASVFIHDTAWDAWSRMSDEKRVRPDLRGVVGSPGEAQFSIIHHELHMAEVDYQAWVVYRTAAPTYVVSHDEVPIVSVYRAR